MRLKNRAVVLLAATVGVSSCAASSSDREVEDASTHFPNVIEVREGWDPDATFNFAATTFATTWDPMLSKTGGDLRYFDPVYDRLFVLDPNGQLKPMLVTDWEGDDDNTSLTLTLRDGVQFSDGTPLDAAAVKFNLDRALGEGSMIAGEIEQITSVEVIDSLTVKINVDGGLGALLSALAARAGVIASPAAAQAGGLNDMPVGSGAFVVESIEPGARVDLVKNPNYWDPDAQRVSAISIRYMADDQTRINALQTGEIDGAALNPHQLNTAADLGLQVLSEPSTMFLYFMVNTAKAPFDDVKVRLALNHAVDRVGISEGLYDGHCTPGVQPWPETSIGYSEQIGDGLDVFDYNPEKAKALLAEAGAEGLEMTSVSIATYVNVAEVIQANLKDVGIEMTVKSVPTPQVTEDFVLNQVVEANINPFSGFADPHGVIARNFLPDAYYNIGEPMPQEMLDVALAASDALDPADRTPLYEEFMDMWMENPPYMMSVCLLHQGTAYGTHVSGVAQGVDWSDIRGVALSS